jgi:23S rRNA (guanosine2251-2'-O)-methyltransferase
MSKKTELSYGIHAVENILQTKPKSIARIWFMDGRVDKRLQKLQGLVRKLNIPSNIISRDGLDKMLKGGERHQGVIAEVTVQSMLGEDSLFNLIEKKDSPVFLLVIDGVQDPHNLGACLRSADAAGVDAVVIPKDKAVGLTPVVRKVACGAAESVPVVCVTNLARTLKQLQQEGVWLVGAAGEASETLYETDLKGNIAIVVGAEGDGMRRLTKEICDYLVKIPMAGIVSSLNVSVATGVMLFEAVRQRQ